MLQVLGSILCVLVGSYVIGLYPTVTLPGCWVLGAILRALVGLGVIKVCSLQVYYRYWLLCKFLSATTALLSGLGLCVLAIGC